MVKSCLVGHSGFVGETLKRKTDFDMLYRSINIKEIRGHSFDLVVCAAAPATKWMANKDPDADYANIEKLMACLNQIQARDFILISTVDVYPNPEQVDEGTEIYPSSKNAYGRHRLILEDFCRNRFDATIIRLPALFGEGLKKNAIYDLMNNNNVDVLQPKSTYQFYDMEMLWEDISRIRSVDIKVVNFATEPLKLGVVSERVFGIKLPENSIAPITNYDFKTRYSDLWNRMDGYTYGSEEILERISQYVNSRG